MPRKKRPVPTPKHVTAVDKIKRAATLGQKIALGLHTEAKRQKPRVKVGTAAALALGIK